MRTSCTEVPPLYARPPHPRTTTATINTPTPQPDTPPKLLRCRLSIAHGCEWLDLEYLDDGPPETTDTLGKSGGDDAAAGGGGGSGGVDGQSRPGTAAQSRPGTAAQAAAGGTEQSRTLANELAKMAKQLGNNEGDATSRPGTSTTSRPGTSAQRSRPGTSASQGGTGRKSGREASGKLASADFGDGVGEGLEEGGMATVVDVESLRNAPLPRRGVLSFVLVPGALGEPMARNTMMKQGPAQRNGPGEGGQEGAAVGGGSDGVGEMTEKLQEDAERQIPDEDGIRSRLEGTRVATAGATTTHQHTHTVTH